MGIQTTRGQKNIRPPVVKDNGMLYFGQPRTTTAQKLKGGLKIWAAVAAPFLGLTGIASLAKAAAPALGAIGTLLQVRDAIKPPPPIIIDETSAPSIPEPSPPSSAPDVAVGSAYAGDFYSSGNLGGVPVGMMGMLPSGLLTAIGQQTVAGRLSQAKASGRRGGQRSARRRKKKAASAPRVRRARRKRSGGIKRLKKGSAAAKRYMAKIRKMRK